MAFTACTMHINPSSRLGKRESLQEGIFSEDMEEARRMMLKEVKTEGAMFLEEEKKIKGVMFSEEMEEAKEMIILEGEKTKGFMLLQKEMSMGAMSVNGDCEEMIDFRLATIFTGTLWRVD